MTKERLEHWRKFYAEMARGPLEAEPGRIGTRLVQLDEQLGRLHRELTRLRLHKTLEDGVCVQLGPLPDTWATEQLQCDIRETEASIIRWGIRLQLVRRELAGGVGVTL